MYPAAASRGAGQSGGLGEEEGGEGLEALFTGGGGAGAALLLIGAVEVLHLGEGEGGVDGGGELRREFVLGVDGGFYFLAAFL